MQLGGFALKKGKKKALKASAGFSVPSSSTQQVPEKVFVTEFDPIAVIEDGAKPLVIPLLKTNAWNAKPNKGKIGTSTEEVGTVSEEQQAVDQILADAKASSSCSAPPRELLIPVVDEREKKRAELYQIGENGRKNDPKKKPILQQNAVPGLDELQDVTDKYRHDVALRPDAPDVHSDVYESVPVEDFGAALLRGMGWKGDADLDDMGEAPQPRHKLLGLGATKRPGENKKKRKKRKKMETQDDSRHSEVKQEDKRPSTDKKQRRSRSQSRSRPTHHRTRSDSRDRPTHRTRSDRVSRDDRGRNRERDRDRDRDRDRRSRSRSRMDSSRSGRRR